MGVFVIAAYRPKPGQEEALIGVLRRHHGILKLQGLVTDFRPVVLKSKAGEYLEIFEWKSEQAVEAAHKNPSVKELRQRFEACCDSVKLGDIAECAEPSPNFIKVHIPVGL